MLLSTTYGFSFIPFAVETVCKLLDLNSMLGLKAGHIVMRYQNIAIPNTFLHAYSIYQGAQEIDLEKIALGKKLKYFIDVLSGLFILNKRFIKKIDIKTVGEFCKNDYYKNIMLSMIKDAEGLYVIPSASGKYKNIFFHTKQDLYTSFNAICNSNIIMFNKFYLMGLLNATIFFHSKKYIPFCFRMADALYQNSNTAK